MLSLDLDLSLRELVLHSKAHRNKSFQQGGRFVEGIPNRFTVCLNPLRWVLLFADVYLESV